jgi:hypothetical protein
MVLFGIEGALHTPSAQKSHMMRTALILSVIGFSSAWQWAGHLRPVRLLWIAAALGGGASTTARQKLEQGVVVGEIAIAERAR